MKKISLLILAILSCVNISLYAQQTDEYKYTADSLFQHLNKTGVTTGVLYDRVFPSAALNNFNLSLPDTSSMWHFVQGYSEYYRSAYSPSGSWITVNQLKENIKLTEIEGKVSIGLGNYLFNVIDTNSIALGSIRLEPTDSFF